MCFEIKIFGLNQQQGAQIIWKRYLNSKENLALAEWPVKVCRSWKSFCQGSPFYTFLKIEKCFKIKFFELNQQQVVQIIWKNIQSSNEVLTLVQQPVKVCRSWKSFCQGQHFTLFRKQKMCLKLKFCAESIVGSSNNMEKYLKFE